MLRRFLVSVLTLLYCTSAIGVPLHLHYCRGELKHITLFVKKECHVPGAASLEHTCCKVAKPHCASVETFNSCCDDATQWLQEHAPAVCLKMQDLVLHDAIAYGIPSPIHAGLENFVRTDTPQYAFSQSAGPPLYLMQCALIFYG